MKGIYAIYSKEDDRCLYVGQSSNIEGRINYHFKRKPKKSYDWHNLIYKQQDKYYTTVLEECDEDVRGERETYYILLLKPLYNITEGGQFVRDVYPESGKTKLRQYVGDNYRGTRKSLVGKIWLNNGIENIVVDKDTDISEYLQKGYVRGQIKRKSSKHSEETKKKIGDSKRNKPLSTKAKANMKESRMKFHSTHTRMYDENNNYRFIDNDKISEYLNNGWSLKKKQK